MHANDFKSRAREALRGKWKFAVCVGLVASLLGAGSSASVGSNFSIDLSGFETSVNTTSEAALADFKAILALIFVVAAPFLLAMLCVSFSLGCIIDIGYSHFNLRLIDNEESSFNDLFAYFPRWKTAVASGFLRSLYIFLWSLLFVIPGIVASLSYAVTSYIIAENDEISAGEALEESKELMRGNRWKLFCLHFSFIGWILLSLLTLGIGLLFLVPYMQMAQTEFYENLKNQIEMPLI